MHRRGVNILKNNLFQISLLRAVSPVGLVMMTLPVYAQLGVSDDRVSLPAGPGSLEGVGENVDVAANMGIMQYSVPISVLAGFAGVTPEMAHV